MLLTFGWNEDVAKLHKEKNSIQEHQIIILDRFNKIVASETSFIL